MGKEERYGMEWGRGMVKLMVFQDHQMATPPEFQSHVVPILWPLTKEIKGGGVTSHVDVFTALKYSNIIRGIIVQNITSHYTEYFNTVLAPVFATYTLPLLGSSITPSGPMRLPTVWTLCP